MEQNVEREVFFKCFPSTIHSEVSSLLEKLTWRRLYYSTESFSIRIDEEIIHIPYRIYYEDQFGEGLTDRENLILDCIFTRHHDGRVREKHLRNILNAGSYLVAPFIAQLLGEYVVEILKVIKEKLTSTLVSDLIKLKSANPAFFKKTEERIESYWNCYHRKTISKNEYVGFQILSVLKEYEDRMA